MRPHLNNNFLKADIDNSCKDFSKIIENSKFLILGGAGSIGKEIVKILFKNNPIKLHVIDLSENNLVELVRDLRSSFGYIKGDFKVFALDIASMEYDKFIEHDGEYDYVLNLSALKHVRSEKDPFTLSRLIETNIFNVEKTLIQSIERNVKSYFSVSTDKASNPVNMMGASKRIMEILMFMYSGKIKVSTARFANVINSDGSLIYSFNQRILKNQPLVAPNDIKRYFISQNTAAQLCLISAFYGNNCEIFFPILNPRTDLISFKELAIEFLHEKNLKPLICDTEDEARNLSNFDNRGFWPCYFSKSETTGEKPFEEFFTKKEVLDLSRYKKIGVIKAEKNFDNALLINFKNEFQNFKRQNNWSRKGLIKIIKNAIPELEHIEKDKFLDDKM